MTYDYIEDTVYGGFDGPLYRNWGHVLEPHYVMEPELYQEIVKAVGSASLHLHIVDDLTLAPMAVLRRVFTPQERLMALCRSVGGSGLEGE